MQVKLHNHLYGNLFFYPFPYIKGKRDGKHSLFQQVCCGFFFNVMLYLLHLLLSKGVLYTVDFFTTPTASCFSTAASNTTTVTSKPLVAYGEPCTVQ